MEKEMWLARDKDKTLSYFPMKNLLKTIYIGVLNVG